MRLNCALISSFLLASAVLALRHCGQHQSQSSNRVDESTNGAVERSRNWAGAVLKGQNFYFAEDTVQIQATSGSGDTIISVVVGIDGATCKGAFLQVGVKLIVGASDYPSYLSWYQWSPGDEVYSEMDIFPGDSIALTVHASSPTTGVVMIGNVFRDAVEIHNLQSEYPLCRQNVEWLVEAVQENGNFVPLANFTSVTYTDIDVDSTSGTYSFEHAETWNIVQNGKTVTRASVDGSSVTIKYP